MVLVSLDFEIIIGLEVLVYLTCMNRFEIRVVIVFKIKYKTYFKHPILNIGVSNLGKYKRFNFFHAIMFEI